MGVLTSKQPKCMTEISNSETILLRQHPENDGTWYYEQHLLGFNYRITDIQCALGISQMKKLDRFAQNRRKLATKYNELLSDCDNIIIPYQHPDCLSSWHLYMIQVPAAIRKEVYDRLWEADIGVNVHYIPVYKLPYYQKHGYADMCCQNAEGFYSRAITLPLFGDMTEEQVQFVADNVRRIVDTLT